MSLPRPASLHRSSPLSRPTPCGRPAAGLDSGCGPASDNQRRERPRRKDSQDNKISKRANRVSTKPGAVQPLVTPPDSLDGKPWPSSRSRRPSRNVTIRGRHQLHIADYSSVSHGQKLSNPASKISNYALSIGVPGLREVTLDLLHRVRAMSGNGSLTTCTRAVLGWAA